MGWPWDIRLGLTALAAIGFVTAQAMAQGASRPPDVAPRAPAAPTIAPTAPLPQAPVQPRVIVPVTPVPQVQGTVAPARPGSPPPYAEAALRPLPGVGVTIPGGQRLVSDANGLVLLPRPTPGVLELNIDTRNVGLPGGGTQPAGQRVLIGILLPAVNAVRGPKVLHATASAGSELQLRIGVDNKGDVTSATFFSGGVFVAAGDVDGDGRADLKSFDDLLQRNPAGGTRLAFKIADNNSPLPQNRTDVLASGGPGAPPHVVQRNTGAPSRWSTAQPLPGVTATLLDSSGRTLGRIVSDGSGLLTLPKLAEGKYDLVLPTAGEGPTAQRVLIGLLLPAVQKLRTLSLPGGGDKRLTLNVAPNGELTRLAWSEGGITAMDDWESPKYLTGSLPAGAGITRLALAREPGLVADSSSLHYSPGTAGGRPTALSGVTVSGRGPAGLFQMDSDALGVARFGELPTGNTLFELKGGDLLKAIRTPAAPGNPTPQKTLVELMIVVCVVAIRRDGEPVVFGAVVPANALPGTVKAVIQIGGDRNAMAVNFGGEPQLPQSLTKVGTGRLTLAGQAGYQGTTQVSQGLLEALQQVARGGKPGDVSAFFAYEPTFLGGVR